MTIIMATKGGTSKPPKKPPKEQKGKRKNRKIPTRIMTVKLPLKHVLVDNPILKEELELAVKRCNTITMRAYELIRFFIISEFNQSGEVTYPSDAVCKYALSLCAGIALKPKTYKSESAQQQKVLKERLALFYETEFKPLLLTTFTKEECRGYTQIFEKGGDMITTTYMNNITAHYLDYLKRFIRYKCLTQYEEEPKDNEEKEERKELRKYEGKRAYQIFKSIAEQKALPEDMEQKFLDIYQECINNYVPTHPLVIPKNEEIGTIYYDIKVNYEKYLILMLRISKFFEANDIKLNQPCPLRHTEVPRFSTFQETFFLTRLGKDFFTDYESIEVRKDSEDKELIASAHFDFWSHILKMNSKVFKDKKRQKLEFYNTFQTDFVSISLQFVSYEKKKTESDKQEETDNNRTSKVKKERIKDDSKRAVTGLMKKREERVID